MRALNFQSGSPSHRAERFCQRLSLVAAALLLGGFMITTDACDNGGKNRLAGTAFGDPGRGAALIVHEGCGACHSISGIRGAVGRVGPPLNNIADRTIIAGLLPNTPPNLIMWLRNPQTIVPGNAMPDMGLSQRDARDIAAYLYSQR